MRNRFSDAMFSILGALGSIVAAGCTPADDHDDGAGVDPTGEVSAALLLPFNITGIVGTGQSLSVGAQAPNFSGAATQPHFNNLKLALNGTVVPPFNSSAPALSLVPFTERIRPLATTFPSAYPANLYGETFHAAMAAQITTLVRATGTPDYVTAHTVVGESGQGMSVINKTATPVNNGGTST